MAFVHYLCVEQWCCRSRHTRAWDGLNCETCVAEYALPPQPSRRNLMWEMRGPGTGGLGGNLMVKDDWLDARPLHVLDPGGTATSSPRVAAGANVVNFRAHSAVNHAD